jgi:hypothetical protein
MPVLHLVYRLPNTATGVAASINLLVGTVLHSGRSFIQQTAAAQNKITN